jgi:hypothetical protein
MGWGAAHAERRRGKGAGPRVAHAGERKGARGKKEKRERANWAGPMGFGLLPSLFFSTQHPNKPFEFKIQFEFKPINSTQIKQCCSMNAQTI